MTFLANTSMSLPSAGGVVASTKIIFYPSLLFFTIAIPAALSGTQTLVIANIITPPSTTTANTCTMTLGITSAYNYVAYKSATVTLTAGTFNQNTGYIPFMDVLNSAPSHPYATYTFLFWNTIALSVGDSIVVTFPSAKYTFTSPYTYTANYVGIVGNHYLFLLKQLTNVTETIFR